MFNSFLFSVVSYFKQAADGSVELVELQRGVEMF